ncbi:hypothetical protein [Chryseolinea sp. H1M3-3]|uniref:hypothetical protein n=1 Tax=Chryseolinea sp. H1M3-3 TaxID=3034144 RepID=UPI0023EBE7C6|nr:hypothetical protein [Chryseolinea sp. H1M3-3]
MLTKSCFTFIFALFVFFTSNAQQAEAPKIEGSPYLDDKYVDGEIFFGEANKVANTKVPVRYNIYQDLMEYQQNGKALALDPSNKIKKVHLGENTFVVEKYELNGKTKYGFLSVLDSGKVMLLSKKMIKFQQALKGRALDGGDQPAKYSRMSDAYFYKIGDGELRQVGNLKELISTFPDKQEELSQYARQEKISPKKEAELLKLIRYYNSL